MLGQAPLWRIRARTGGLSGVGLQGNAGGGVEEVSEVALTHPAG